MYTVHPPPPPYTLYDVHPVEGTQAHPKTKLHNTLLLSLQVCSCSALPITCKCMHATPSAAAACTGLRLWGAGFGVEHKIGRFQQTFNGLRFLRFWHRPAHSPS